MIRSILTASALCAALMLAVPAYAEEGEGKGARKGPKKCKHRIARAFKKFDKNSDGALTAVEVPAKLWTRLSKADADGSGSVTREEVRAACKARKGKRGKRGGKSGK